MVKPDHLLLRRLKNIVVFLDQNKWGCIIMPACKKEYRDAKFIYGLPRGPSITSYFMCLEEKLEAFDILIASKKPYSGERSPALRRGKKLVPPNSSP